MNVVVSGSRLRQELQVDLYQSQVARVDSEFDRSSGLYGHPSRYYDQNLTLFGMGSEEGRFSFDVEGALQLRWRRNWLVRALIPSGRRGHRK